MQKKRVNQMRTRGFLTLTIGIVCLTALFVGNVSAQTSSPSAAKIAVADPITSVVSVEATKVTLATNTSTAAVGQWIGVTATLTSGNTPLSSQPVAIYHYFNGTRYDDITVMTNANGQAKISISFNVPGQRTLYAVFAGDSLYGVSTSNAVVVHVH
jgi:hypothetical protein